LLDTWPKSSSVNSVNLVKKICYSLQFLRYRIFLGDCFLLAHPVYVCNVDEQNLHTKWMTENAIRHIHHQFRCWSRDVAGRHECFQVVKCITVHPNAVLSQTARLPFTQIPFGHFMSDINQIEQRHTNILFVSSRSEENCFALNDVNNDRAVEPTCKNSLNERPFYEPKLSIVCRVYA